MRINSMLTFCIVIALAGLLICASCQGQSATPSRQSAAAGSQQDVVNAWNSNCVSCNFDTIFVVSGVEVGAIYNGADFAADAAQLMSKMQIELMSGSRPTVDENELLSAVLGFPGWYE